jgi:hypothetical protein
MVRFGERKLKRLPSVRLPPWSPLSPPVFKPSPSLGGARPAPVNDKTNDTTCGIGVKKARANPMVMTDPATREDVEAGHRKELKALEGEKRAALKKAKATKGKNKAKDEVAAYVWVGAHCQNRLEMGAHSDGVV